ncbi:MAG TPA: lysylphosphatidylglycerol synthase domain-containing protein [Rhodanobacteraceae bacterium]|nr:lysylphosphatidylglycerol synthase domain-containing protein [Rhodanobacteraceae bacterium]
MLKMLSRARGLLKPQVVLPVLLAGALLVFAFKLGNLHQVMSRLNRLSLTVLGIALASAACYLGCKALQLKLMLTRIGVPMPARPFWLAFAVGELTVTLPLGLFSQNWVMSASRRVDVGRSSAATVMMLLAEIAAVFLFLAVVGIPGWGQLRFAAVGALAFFVALVCGLLLFEHKARQLVSHIRHPRAKQVADAGLELLGGLRRLSTAPVLTISLILAAIYLGSLTFAFWFVGRGMAVHDLHYLTASRIYLFALAVILVGGGLFSQIGTVDVLGMMAARACGIGYTDGLAMMLGFRIVWTGSVWLLCLPIVGMMWRAIPRHGHRPSGDGGEKPSD